VNVRGAALAQRAGVWARLVGGLLLTFIGVGSIIAILNVLSQGSFVPISHVYTPLVLCASTAMLTWAGALFARGLAMWPDPHAEGATVHGSGRGRQAARVASMAFGALVVLALLVQLGVGGWAVTGLVRTVYAGNQLVVAFTWWTVPLVAGLNLAVLYFVGRALLRWRREVRDAPE
jgi:hypothetical protein